MTPLATPVPFLDSAASWRVLAGAGIVFVFSVTALLGSTLGLFMVPLQQELGWGRADIAFALTLTTAVAWFALLFGGWLADHARLRPLLLSGVVLGAANLAAFSFMMQLWQFYLLMSALAFTALGASPLMLSKLVQGWFDKRLGHALGLLFACVSVGAIIHPMIITAVIEHGGWRRAFLAMGAMALVGGGAAVLLVIREPVRPAAVPFVEKSSARAPMIAFLGQRTWWTLAIWNVLFGFGSGSIGIHFAALLHDRGIDAIHIGMAASMIGVSLFVGNLLTGWLVDRVSPQRMAWVLMLLPLAATLLLLVGRDLPVMLVAAALLGLATGSDGSLGAFLVRFYFGARQYGQASSTQMLAMGIGNSLAPWLSGLMRDRTGNYGLSLSCAAVAFGLAVVLGLLLPRKGHAPLTLPLEAAPLTA